MKDQLAGSARIWLSDKFTQLSLAAYTATDAASQKAANAAWNNFVTDSAHVTALTTQSPRALAQANVRGLAWDVGGAFPGYFARMVGVT